LTNRVPDATEVFCLRVSFVTMGGNVKHFMVTWADEYGYKMDKAKGADIDSMIVNLAKGDHRYVLDKPYQAGRATAQSE
jgi:hypothetical protein